LKLIRNGGLLFSFTPNKINMQHKVTYIDHRSVLLVNPSGQLKKLEVPFTVYLLKSDLPNKQYFEVQEVLSTERDEIVYVIGSKPFFHHHFAIDILF